MGELREGVRYWPRHFDEADQQKLLDLIRLAVQEAPLFTPEMPKTGKPMSVRMTNFGKLGWVTDKKDGYRYQASHPQTERAWPKIPEMLLTLWDRLAQYSHPPEACLVNYYGEGAKMGLHQDRDEEDFEAPVLSVSLGDDCLFRVGGTTRGGKTSSIRLRSGDVLMLSGPARMSFHGVDKLYAGTSSLLKNAGRINLTLRRVSKPGN